MSKDGVKTVLSIGAFFLGAGGWNPFGLGAVGAGGLMGGLMGVSLMNTIWAATHKPEQPSYDSTSRFDQMMNNVSSESMVTVIYGRRKWAGNQLWHSASSDGRSLTKDVLVGEGECDSISEVEFNDIALPISGCSYEFHNGSVTQEPPDNFDVVGGYRRMAWLRCNMTISEQLQGNNPTVTYVVKGLKVLDTRTGVTAWSDNNAMCVRDFLLSKRYGISKFVHGMVLDEQSFKEAADYCDEFVSYYDANGVLRQEKRYTLNIILDQKRKANEHLDAILATFGGFLVNNNGVISLRIEKPETSSYHFTNDTIVENSVNIEQLSLDESPNQYKIGYFDETQNWTQVKALVNDIIDQQLPPVGKGKVVTKELTLDGCTSQSQALRLGRLYKLKNKLCSLTMTFKTSTFAMHLQCGDVVTMTYDKVDDDGTVYPVFTDKPWRIIEISEQDGIYSTKAREYNASIYGDVTEVIEVKTYTSIERSIVADTAIALANPQTINGVPFNGTVPIEIPANIEDSGVTAGTYTKVTVNAKGLVEYGENPSTLSSFGISDAYTKDDVDGIADAKADQITTYSKAEVDTKIGLGIELRISGASLEASLDNGVTWKIVTLT